MPDYQYIIKDNTVQVENHEHVLTVLDFGNWESGKICYYKSLLAHKSDMKYAEAYLKQMFFSDDTPQQRENYVNEWYRERLKSEIEKRLPKWEMLTGLHCSSWQTKYMTTKWGTCNTTTGKIWINLQLAKKPFECLDYVILHELIHLKYRKHDKHFIDCLDSYLPYWREIRKQLNESTLDYLDI